MIQPCCACSVVRRFKKMDRLLVISQKAEPGCGCRVGQAQRTHRDRRDRRIRRFLFSFSRLCICARAVCSSMTGHRCRTMTSVAPWMMPRTGRHPSSAADDRPRHHPRNAGGRRPDHRLLCPGCRLRRRTASGGLQQRGDAHLPPGFLQTGQVGRIGTRRPCLGDLVRRLDTGIQRPAGRPPGSEVGPGISRGGYGGARRPGRTAQRRTATARPVPVPVGPRPS